MDGDNIIGMAGASAGSETMWQIGVNVMPGYCSRGIGTKLVVLFAVVVFAIKTAAEDIVIDFKKNLIDDLKKTKP